MADSIPGAPAAAVPDTSILTAAELDSIRRPYRGARLLPGRAYHDQAIFEWEREHVLRRDWVIVGREDEAPDPGTYFLTELDGEPLLVVRARDGVLRAFYNVCRHRGTAVVEEPCGTAVRFQCPYHAWIYDLEGRLVRAKHTEDLDDFAFGEYGLAQVGCETWQGFVFLNLDPDAAPLAAQLGDLDEHLRRFDFGDLRPARTMTYDVAANWKFIAENYSECYHCPPLHPQLNKLTPYDVGGDYAPDGAWQGGWMELVAGAETMALDGGRGSKHGRPPMCGMTAEDERRIFYYVLWPTAFLSIHPDYLLVHRLVPVAPDRTTVVCQLLFEPETMAPPDFDPTDAIAFWDLTNTQDWHVCELQQRGTRSRSWVSGRYSNQEASVHAFDQMVAERYAGLEFSGLRTVRARYDVAPPKEAPIGQLDAGVPRHDEHDHPTTGRGSHEHATARTTARSKATGAATSR
ncbi:MAG TPA: aromatic ring-hydroxylating dioxygenase subunit alpha [Candidatus Limnocylindrales bacterium]|nr:aromatic ring-hydroxylating dioxygenase subunit alpha [Candidatus Limnocylindrales bacterium]